MTVGDPAAFCSLFPGLKELIQLYQELDQEVGRFKKAADLNCLKLCKKCCTAGEEQIEASVFECLPLSIHLWRAGQAEEFLQKNRLGCAKRSMRVV